MTCSLFSLSCFLPLKFILVFVYLTTDPFCSVPGRRASLFVQPCGILWQSILCTTPRSLWLPCSSPSPGACSNSCPLSRWCHPTISSSVIPFFSCPQSFPASGSFPRSWLFASGGQSIGASASVSVLPKNIQGWFPLGLTGLISFLSKGLSRVFSSTTVQRYQFFSAQPFLLSGSHIFTWLPGKLLERVERYLTTHFQLSDLIFYYYKTMKGGCYMHSPWQRELMKGKRI